MYSFGIERLKQRLKILFLVNEEPHVFLLLVLALFDFVLLILIFHVFILISVDLFLCYLVDFLGIAIATLLESALRLFFSRFALDVDPGLIILEQPVLALPLVNTKHGRLDIQALVLLLNPLDLLRFLRHLIIELLDVVGQLVLNRV